MSKNKVMLVAVIFILSFSSFLYAQLADSPWPMFHRDVRHTAQCPYYGPDNPELKWTFMAEPGITASPVIGSDGTIYFGSWDGYFYALNPDGTIKWYFLTQDKVTATPAISLDGTIYIESRDGSLYALDPDGTLKWEFWFGTHYYNSFPGTLIGDDGTIYVSSDTLYAINPDGTEKWRFEDQIDEVPGVQSSAVIGPDGTIFISRRKHIVAIDQDGIELWRFNMGYYTFNALAVGPDGSLYVGSDSAELLGMNPDGTEKWRFQAQSSFVLSPTIAADGTVYAASEDDYFYAVNPDGSLKWKFKADKLIRSSSAIDADGIIYFNSWDKHLYALYPDGSLKWKFKTTMGIVSAPAMNDDGTLYFGSYDGCFFAVGDSRKVFFNLDTEPETRGFSEEDKFKLTLDVKTYSENVTADIYIAILNPSVSDLYFGFNWDIDPSPAVSGISIPANFSIKDATILDLAIPSILPPIDTQGSYIFAIVAFDSLTGELLSNVETLDFLVSE